MPLYRRALIFPALVLLGSIGAAAESAKFAWLSLGGSVIAAWGTWLWGSRLFRLKPDRADDPPPPHVTVFSPTGMFSLDPDYFNEQARRNADNHRALIGIWLTIIGTLLAGAVPVLLDALKR